MWISIFLKLNLLTVVVLLGFKSESYRAHFHSLIIVWGEKNPLLVDVYQHASMNTENCKVHCG